MSSDNGADKKILFDQAVVDEVKRLVFDILKQNGVERYIVCDFVKDDGTFILRNLLDAQQYTLTGLSTDDLLSSALTVINTNSLDKAYENHLTAISVKAFQTGLDKILNRLEDFETRVTASFESVLNEKIDTFKESLTRYLSDKITDFCNEVDSHYDLMAQLVADNSNIVKNNVDTVTQTYKNLITSIVQLNNDMTTNVTKVISESDRYLETKYETTKLIVESKTYLNEMQNVLNSVNARIVEIKELSDQHEAKMKIMLDTITKVTDALATPAKALVVSETVENVVNSVRMLLPKKETI